MPYYINCPRCNKDNKYTSLGNDCPKCSGSGRDWRDDRELANFHSWSGLSINDLRDRQVVEVKHHEDIVFFHFMEKIPSYTIKEEIEKIRESLGVQSEIPSQLFCEHQWEQKFSESGVTCRLCGKKQAQESKVANLNSEFKYNKQLHNQRYYFPNRCYACEEFSNTTSPNGNPVSGDDIVVCKIGGEVRADDGCGYFNADVTAVCSNCWNLKREHCGFSKKNICDIRGPLSKVETGYCSDHVSKEPAGVSKPPVKNAVSISRKYSLKQEYPNDPAIRESLGVRSEVPSQLFCEHQWEQSNCEGTKTCRLCGKKQVQEGKVANFNIEFKYNKQLHDQRYYFPNRCYACERYASTTSLNGSPVSADDIVVCKVGGEVRADEGCSSFKADVTATCSNFLTCWNLTRQYNGILEKLTCDIRGPLSQVKTGYCSDHVSKEPTGVSTPPVKNAVSISRKWSIKQEYPNYSAIRRPILDAMNCENVRMVSHKEFSFDKRCNTCEHLVFVKNDFGRCEQKNISLLGFTGSNPYGYDEKICDKYERSSNFEEIKYPKVYVDVLGSGSLTLNDDFHLTLNNMYCEIIETKKDRVIANFNYSDRAPNFVQYNEDLHSLDLYFFYEPFLEHFEISENVTYEQPEPEKTWNSVPEDEIFSALDEVVRKQRLFSVYNGTRRENCEECQFVNLDPSYPDGSPSGLVCSKKDIFVSATGCCDDFKK